MFKRICWLLIAALLATLAPMPAPASAQGIDYPLDNCRLGAFSTEEDFMMQRNEPYDGNPYISDGDVLSPSGQVCARNADLLAAFYATARAPDLGLDALDILDITDRIVAFSTELDDTGNRFTAGDLLFTLGYVIPNIALVHPFGITYDIGLDGVQFIGTRDDILKFVDSLANTPRSVFLQNPGLLKALLERYTIDIWFSIEGTVMRVGAPSILDGDLLSAATGTIVASNATLLPPDVPAGLPARGVDFGLDAVAAPRTGDVEGRLSALSFSTEILYESEKFSFTDGDVLLSGDGIQATNESLVANFFPAADFLGLDALWIPFDEPPPQDPNIQTMCGDRSVVDFDGGLVAIGGPGTGLYRENPSAAWPAGRPRRPCGSFVPIDGYLPSSGVTRFRVAYRAAGSPVPVVGTASGIRTTWELYEWRWFPIPGCYISATTLSTDANGWMDASDYLGAKNGTLTGCANPGLRLAVWNTDNIAGFDPGPANENGHYVLWLEWEDAGGLDREPFDHHLQLDNTLPAINDFKVTLADGTTPVGACGEAPAGQSIFKVFADFEDDYYWGYYLRVRGGNPPASASWGWHNYYDGTPEVANTDETGTIPDNTTVLLRSIDMTALGASFTDCCYVLDLWIRDATIRHTFNRRVANDVTGADAWWDNAFITFAAAP